MGIAPRAEITYPAQAKKYLDMGVKHFCIGSDVSILFDWFKASGGEMLKTLGRNPVKTRGNSEGEAYAGG
jgi:4-hydroxy-2-oxoheptanedioate aldolase